MIFLGVYFTLLFVVHQRKTLPILGKEQCLIIGIRKKVSEFVREDNNGNFPSRETMSGKNFMMKQELIDAAEASGLSRSAIGYSFTVNARCCLFKLLFLVHY